MLNVAVEVTVRELRFTCPVTGPTGDSLKVASTSGATPGRLRVIVAGGNERLPLKAPVVASPDPWKVPGGTETVRPAVARWERFVVAVTVALTGTVVSADAAGAVVTNPSATATAASATGPSVLRIKPIAVLLH